MMVAAESSRQPLYYEAAELVNKRRRIQEGDQDEINDLLRNTAITPDDKSTLFELFVLFRFIRALDDIRSDSATLETIEAGKNEIARFETSPEILLYHDKTPDEPDASFEMDESFGDDDELSRSDRVQKVAKEFTNDYFDEGYRNYTGRPDVLVLQVKDPDRDEYEYLITEVKNSTNKSTIKRGVRETLEYLAFLQVEDPKGSKEYIHENTSSDIFGSECRGLLVVRDLDKDTRSFDDQSSEMKILQASELEENLPKMLVAAFGGLN
jgi:hypothetical protein